MIPVRVSSTDGFGMTCNLQDSLHGVCFLHHSTKSYFPLPLRVGLLSKKIPTMTMWSSLLSSSRVWHTTRRTMLSFFQREVGLFRYHGPIQYWIRRNNNNNNNNQQTAGMTNVARVPFMVTQAQRLRLQQELGYTRQEIQHLTPMDVTVILQHQVRSEERESRLESLLLQTTMENVSTTKTTTTTKVWYQVLEECEITGQCQVIGLYSNRDEATLVRDTKESLAQKHLTRDRKSTRLNSSHRNTSRMPSSA